MQESKPDYILTFDEIDQTDVAYVGGKGAHLAALARTGGIRVPAGFCVTTDAFRRVVPEIPGFTDLLDRLSGLKPDDIESIRTLSAENTLTIEVPYLSTRKRTRSFAYAS